MLRRKTRRDREIVAAQVTDLGTPETQRRAVVREIKGVGRRAQMQHPLDRLLSRGSIDNAAWKAGMRFLDDYEVGIMQARQAPEDPGFVDRSRFDHGIPTYVLMRSNKVDAAAKAVGTETCKLLVRVVVDRHTVEALSRTHREAAELMGVLRAGLRSLVMHYERVDGRRKIHEIA